MSDYFNLLYDSLRSSHHQVEKIYNRLSKLRTGQYVNVRTSYCMKYRNDTNYVYSRGLFPLCWNSDELNEYSPIVVERLLNKYEEWLADYKANGDNDRIKQLIDEEKENAKNEPDVLRKIRTRIEDFYDKAEQSEEDDDDDDDEDDLDSFIVQDDEEQVKKRRKVFKKKLGKRPRKFKRLGKVRIIDEEEEVINLLNEADNKNCYNIQNKVVIDLVLDEEEDNNNLNENKEYENINLILLNSDDSDDSKMLKRKRLQKKGRKIIKDSDDEEF